MPSRTSVSSLNAKYDSMMRTVALTMRTKGYYKKGKSTSDSDSDLESMPSASSDVYSRRSCDGKRVGRDLKLIKLNESWSKPGVSKSGQDAYEGGSNVSDVSAIRLCSIT
jgi:hypothetical protein